MRLPHRGYRAIDPGPILLLGGLSDIGMEVASRLVSAARGNGDGRGRGDDPGRTVVLAARRTLEPGRARALEANAATLREAGAAAVVIREFDADDLGSHTGFVAAVEDEVGPPGVTVLAFGILGDQALAESDPAHTAAILRTDFVAQASMLTALAASVRAAPAHRGRRGSIIVFSSVAGVRVRRANYVYGSAKAGLDGFATGLSDALAGSGVHLLLARPGFVIGSMTRDLMAAGTTAAPMSSTPGQVADAVVRALAARRRIVWVPGRLRAVFMLARMVPPPIWRRLPR